MPDYNNPQLMNVEEALGRIRGNKVLYNRMLQMFLQGKDFEALEESLANNDYARAGEVAHAIKGVTGNLSLMALFEVSTQLMNELRHGEAPDEKTLTDYRFLLKETIQCVEGYLADNN